MNFIVPAAISGAADMGRWREDPDLLCAPPRARRGAPERLPPELAFLLGYGIGADELLRAAHLASKQGVRPEAALLAGGSVGESFYYRSLAHRLGAEFVCGFYYFVFC